MCKFYVNRPGFMIEAVKCFKCTANLNTGIYKHQPGLD